MIKPPVPDEPKKWYQPSPQFTKYIAGGALNFWVGYAVFALFYSGLGWYWLWAKGVADFIGWNINYIAQRYWAFSGQHHLREIQHIGRYLTIEFIGLVLDYLIIGGLRFAGITPYFGFFISALFFTGWSYLWYKYWVFPKPKPNQEPATI